MNSKVIIAALLMVGTIPFAATPFATASHFSVGTYDAVGLQPTEDADGPMGPSVPADSDLYERGTSATDTNTGQPCSEYDGHAEDAQSEANQALASDPFCGALVYNQGSTYEEDSPVDQDFPLKSNVSVSDLQFDVVTQSFVGIGLGSCLPFWCFEGTADVFQDALALTGLGDDSSTYKEESGGYFEYQGQSPNLGYPNAYMVAQQATGLNEGNGWIGPSGESSFFAFLSTPDDESIDADELATLVQDLKRAGELPEGAEESICAFTPDASISISAGSESFCEVTFTYYSDETVDSDPDFDDYDSDCNSPTYICGANQPGWYANLVMLDRPECKYGCPQGDTVADSDADQASQSTTDYDVWHFVVAPTASPCSGAAEPGFAIDQADVGSSADAPYLAHDLDIYSPATSGVGVKNVDSVDQWIDAFAVETQADTTDPVLETVDEITSLQLGETTDYTLFKDRTLEPNAAGDTSQESRDLDTDGELTRDLTTDECSQFTPGEEFADPWVNYIDVFLWEDFFFGVTPVHDADNNDPNQDASNAPGPGFFYMEGHVGMFTDKNDDGDYDWASGETANKGEAIQNVGAYPLWMDMQVSYDETNDTFAAVEGGGCTMGFNENKLNDALIDAGYGIHTGVVQVIYLNEPTVLMDIFGFQYYEYLTGNNAFVLMNQALTTLYHNGDAKAAELVDNALGKAGLSLAGAGTDYNLVFPGQEAGYLSDFDSQCRAETGEIDPKWEFFHSCQLDCSNDKIVTAYYAELTNADGSLGGGGAIPVFDPNGTAFDFSVFDSNNDGIIEMYDVDPLTDDPADNDRTATKPPTSD